MINLFSKWILLFCRKIQLHSIFLIKLYLKPAIETILEKFQLVLLDSGRYKTPVPNWGYAGYDKWNINHKYTYKYYLKESNTYKLQQFFFDIENEEEVYAKRKFDAVVLYYENEKEKLTFESNIENNQKIIDHYIAEVDNVYFTIDSGNEREVQVHKHDLSIGLALNKALQEFKKYHNKYEQITGKK
ncbi:hypothetical protein C2W64_02282 [Brevibacillus laterosporus]|nr:hypothetical protein [Brevibacillus laterosporus]RAP25922.1 hypothetical protein C2W64_02282 [Brevibacillus laterosporus]